MDARCFFVSHVVVSVSMCVSALFVPLYCIFCVFSFAFNLVSHVNLKRSKELPNNPTFHHELEPHTLQQYYSNLTKFVRIPSLCSKLVRISSL